VSACAQSPNGDLFLFGCWNSRYLPFNLSHEDSHYIHKSTSLDDAPVNYPKEHALFCDAVEVEWRDYDLDPVRTDEETLYSLTCYAEHWAVAGQQNLHRSGAQALHAILNAPLRSFVYMSVLEMELAALSQGTRPTCHQHYLARILLSRQTVRERSRECLQRIRENKGKTYQRHEKDGTLGHLRECVERVEAYVDEVLARPMLEEFRPSFNSSGEPKLLYLTPPCTTLSELLVA
jgi:hypothetical protein